MDRELTQDSPEKQRKVGGYIWRERLEDAEQIALDLLVAEDGVTERAKLRRLHDILTELERYRCGGGD